MVDDIDQGRRPIVAGTSESTGEAIHACPGIGLRHDERQLCAEGNIPEMLSAWGPVLEVWEGYAADEEIRFAGSSGGAASALALSELSNGRAQGVVHIAQRNDVAYLNETVISTSREELLARTGSRYAPASPCDTLHHVEASGEPHVFIGKPCDVAAVAQGERLRPAWRDLIPLRIAFFCAGTPSTAGTLEMLGRMGVDDVSTLSELRYRGNGWPGLARASFTRDGRESESTLTYAQSWGEVLTSHKPWRCNICPDHTGEFGDIAVGDPWYRTIEEGEAGCSLILVRTERGREALRRAIESGHVLADRADASILPDSQGNLLAVRGAVWGRTLVMRLSGVPTPRYVGMPMFRVWLRTLSLKRKLQSLVGTFRRLRRKGLFGERDIVPHEPVERCESVSEATR
ncbi:MAG: Coenzyme F420 hydrogenase/dehydrogenase, beta subunit C-terminal domain [Planctomycetota bacterium]|jgi:coenzyme F420 hydrogenase subunit beta